MSPRIILVLATLLLSHSSSLSCRLNTAVCVSKVKTRERTRMTFWTLNSRVFNSMNMPEIHEINWKPVFKRWKKDGRKMGTFIRVTRNKEESAYKVVLRHLAKRTEMFLYKS